MRYQRTYLSYDPKVQRDKQLAQDIGRIVGQLCSVYLDRAPITSWWADLIETELKESDLCVAILSPESSKDDVISAELEIAARVASTRSGLPIVLSVLVADYKTDRVTSLDSEIDFSRSFRWIDADDTHPLTEWISEWLDTARTLVTRDRFVSPTGTVELPEGTFNFSSPLYADRSSDRHALRFLEQRSDATLTIKGPRHVGKSSLLVRLIDAARRQNKIAVLIDFQLLGNEVLSDRKLFYQCLIAEIADGLQRDPPTGPEDHEEPPSWCNRALDSLLTAVAPSEVLLAIDELDLLLQTGYWQEFLDCVRAWGTNRAIDPAFKRLWTVLVTSTEPYLDLDSYSSPFNIGDVVELSDLEFKDILDLNKKHGAPFSDEQVRRLFDLVGGHPYLIRRALYSVSSGQFKPQDVTDPRIAACEGGPFNDHLRDMLEKLKGHEELAGALSAALGAGAHPSRTDQKRLWALRGLGLVQYGNGGLRIRCDLYRQFFRNRLDTKGRVNIAGAEA